MLCTGDVRINPRRLEPLDLKAIHTGAMAHVWIVGVSNADGAFAKGLAQYSDAKAPGYGTGTRRSTHTGDVGYADWSELLRTQTLGPSAQRTYVRPMTRVRQPYQFRTVDGRLTPTAT